MMMVVVETASYYQLSNALPRLKGLRGGIILASTWQMRNLGPLRVLIFLEERASSEDLLRSIQRSRPIWSIMHGHTVFFKRVVLIARSLMGMCHKSIAMASNHVL